MTTRTVSRAVGVCACLLAAGCATGPIERSGPESDTGASLPAAGRAERVAAGPRLSPIDRYKQQRLNEALRGLIFDSGRVAIDPAVAREYPRGDLARATERFDAGTQHYTHNEFVEAIGALRDAIMIAPNLTAAYEVLGDALLAKGEVAWARAAYRTALEADPQQVGLLLRIARTWEMEGDLGQAIAAYEQVLQVDPGVAEAHERLAVQLYYAGDLAGAWAHVEQAEALGHEMPAQFVALLKAGVMNQ